MPTVAVLEDVFYVLVRLKFFASPFFVGPITFVAEVTDLLCAVIKFAQLGFGRVSGGRKPTAKVADVPTVAHVFLGGSRFARRNIFPELIGITMRSIAVEKLDAALEFVFRWRK